MKDQNTARKPCKFKFGATLDFSDFNVVSSIQDEELYIQLVKYKQEGSNLNESPNLIDYRLTASISGTNQSELRKDSYVHVKVNKILFSSISAAIKQRMRCWVCCRLQLYSGREENF